MKTIYPASWSEYELLDCGEFEKLERFGKYTLIRPEPQALWPKTRHDWNKVASATFVREQKDKFRFTDDVKGGWTKHGSMPDSWQVNYRHKDIDLTLRLALTGFGHVGVFPEQGDNWNFIDETIRGWSTPEPRLLNLFAYTGAASVVARAAGADVIHVDSSRPGLNWANQNMKLNGLSDIHWVHEDALKFIRREVKRGSRYNGIIMDPPPYGRGPKGEKWVLQEHLSELVQLASQLLTDHEFFFILNLYAAGVSPIAARNVVASHLKSGSMEYGEFFLKCTAGKDLPMGVFVRLR